MLSEAPSRFHGTNTNFKGSRGCGSMADSFGVTTAVNITALNRISSYLQNTLTVDELRKKQIQDGLNW